MDSCVNRTSDESSSSIGKDSDDVSGNSVAKSGEGEEIQSPYKGPLDAVEDLEDALPMRRGISKFYNGKSKSLATLADAASSLASAKDLSKPENAYTRRRRNRLACSLRGGSTSIRMNGFGMKTKVASAVSMTRDKREEEEEGEGECCNSFRPFSSLGSSYSSVDLQQQQHGRRIL